MKTSCEIIKDLLPLYLDGVCSDESKAMIEEHLLECEDCKAEFQEMENNFIRNKKDENLLEAEAIKSLSKQWKRGMKNSLLRGVMITIIVFAIIAFILYLFMITNYAEVEFAGGFPIDQFRFPG